MSRPWLFSIDEPALKASTWHLQALSTLARDGHGLTRTLVITSDLFASFVDAADIREHLALVDKSLSGASDTVAARLLLSAQHLISSHHIDRHSLTVLSQKFVSVFGPDTTVSLTVRPAERPSSQPLRCTATPKDLEELAATIVRAWAGQVVDSRRLLTVPDLIIQEEVDGQVVGHAVLQDDQTLRLEYGYGSFEDLQGGQCELGQLILNPLDGELKSLQHPAEAAQFEAAVARLISPQEIIGHARTLARICRSLGHAPSRELELLWSIDDDNRLIILDSRGVQDGDHGAPRGAGPQAIGPLAILGRLRPLWFSVAQDNFAAYFNAERRALFAEGHRLCLRDEAVALRWQTERLPARLPPSRAKPLLAGRFACDALHTGLIGLSERRFPALNNRERLTPRTQLSTLRDQLQRAWRLLGRWHQMEATLRAWRPRELMVDVGASVLAGWYRHLHQQASKALREAERPCGGEAIRTFMALAPTDLCCVSLEQSLASAIDLAQTYRDATPPSRNLRHHHSLAAWLTRGQLQAVLKVRRLTLAL